MEITVRNIEPDDYEALHKIMTAPRVQAGTLQLPFESQESWRKKLSEPPSGLYSLVACARGEVVGSATLTTFPQRPRISHVGELGIAIRDDWQGKGVGTKLMEALMDLADNWLGLVRIGLEVYPDNEAAIALYRKFGFEVEGTLRLQALRDGEYVDSLAMGRIREDLR